VENLIEHRSYSCLLLIESINYTLNIFKTQNMYLIEVFLDICVVVKGERERFMFYKENTRNAVERGDNS
jgi:hypothetical protein